MLDRIDHLLGDDVFVVEFLVFFAPELELALNGGAQDFGVLRPPPLKAFLFCVAFAVNFEKGEQPLEEAITGKLEGGNGTLKALEEVGADQTHHLPLTVLLEWVDVLIRSAVPVQWVVQGQREQRIFLRECPLKQIEHPSVGLAD